MANTTGPGTLDGTGNVDLLSLHEGLRKMVQDAKDDDAPFREAAGLDEEEE